MFGRPKNIQKFTITSNYLAEGWLSKESHDGMRSWRERYFVLNSLNRKLSFYDEAEKITMKGEWDLSENASVDLTDSRGGSHQNLFVVSGKRSGAPGQSELFVSANSLDIRDSWVEAIRKTIMGALFTIICCVIYISSRIS
jgi:hypothetical protein